MSKLIDIDCNSCTKKDEGCCKVCFNERDTNVFKCLSDNELNLLMGEKQQIVYEPGEIIVKQNTPSTYAVCIRSGLAKVTVTGHDKKKIIVKLISNLDFITGGDLFNGHIQPYTIKAITPVECCLVDSVKLTKLFTSNSQFAIELLRHHTKQSNYLLGRLVNLTQKYMPGRVADTLLYLKDEVYQSNPFSVPLTRKELADMSNMTKEGFVRVLQELKSSGIIQSTGNTFEILDTIALQSISKNG